MTVRWMGLPIAACAVAAALFGYAFHQQYWRWRDCFNELGRCYDPEGQVVYLEQAGIVWGLFTIVPAAVGLLLWLRTRHGAGTR